MLKAQQCYQQASQFLVGSQAKLGESIAEMEKQLEAVTGKEDQAKCQEALATMRKFKSDQKEKLSAVQQEIERLDPKLGVAMNTLAAEAKPVKPEETSIAT